MQRRQLHVQMEISHNWCPSAVPLGMVLFNIIINHIDKGTEHTLSKFTRDTKVSGAADNLDWRQAIQRDFHRLEEEENIKFKKFSKAMCKVHTWGNFRYQYRLSG